jgi:creatinine amidohydrolase
MRWDELTGEEFGPAVRDSQGVCLVALSVVERHGRHLPVGTDTMIGEAVLDRVAEQEPVVLFPPYIFTQVPEARHCVGTISIDPQLMVALLDNVCREISRNGFHTIVLVNCHGGNRNFLPFFVESQLARRQDHTVHLVEPIAALFGRSDLPWPPEAEGHAGPGETSIMMASRPELVHMAEIPDAAEGAPLHRLRALQEAGVRSGIDWYADYPTHFMGAPGPATPGAGEVLLDAMAEHVVRAVRAIKADDGARALQEEFYAAAAAPSVPRLPQPAS